jgi:hypothetical protein
MLNAKRGAEKKTPINQELYLNSGYAKIYN